MENKFMTGVQMIELLRSQRYTLTAISAETGIALASLSMIGSAKFKTGCREITLIKLNDAINKLRTRDNW